MDPIQPVLISALQQPPRGARGTLRPAPVSPLARIRARVEHNIPEAAPPPTLDLHTFLLPGSVVLDEPIAAPAPSVRQRRESGFQSSRHGAIVIVDEAAPPLETEVMHAHDESKLTDEAPSETVRADLSSHMRAEATSTAGPMHSTHLQASTAPALHAIGGRDSIHADSPLVRTGTNAALNVITLPTGTEQSSAPSSVTAANTPAAASVSESLSVLHVPAPRASQTTRAALHSRRSHRHVRSSDQATPSVLSRTLDVSAYAVGALVDATSSLAARAATTVGNALARVHTTIVEALQDDPRAQLRATADIDRDIVRAGRVRTLDGSLRAPSLTGPGKPRRPTPNHHADSTACSATCSDAEGDEEMEVVSVHSSDFERDERHAQGMRRQQRHSERNSRRAGADYMWSVADVSSQSVERRHRRPHPRESQSRRTRSNAQRPVTLHLLEDAAGSMQAPPPRTEPPACRLCMYGGEALSAALLLSVANGHEKCMQRLLGAAAGALASARDGMGRYALHIACAHQRELLVPMLLEAGCDANAADDAGNTALHTAAHSGLVSSVMLLLDANIDAVFVARSVDGATPLHVASEAGHASVVRLLLESAADVHACNSRGRTPLLLAGSADVVRLLMAAGANAGVIDARGENPLHTAARAPKERAFELTLAMWDAMPEQRRQLALEARSSDDGHTPLLTAAANGSVRALEALLQLGADLHVVSGAGMSAAHVAAAAGKATAAAFLLRQEILSRPPRAGVHSHDVSSGAEVRPSSVRAATPVRTTAGPETSLQLAAACDSLEECTLPSVTHTHDGPDAGNAVTAAVGVLTAPHADTSQDDDAARFEASAAFFLQLLAASDCERYGEGDQRVGLHQDLPPYQRTPPPESDTPTSASTPMHAESSVGSGGDEAGAGPAASCTAPGRDDSAGEEAEHTADHADMP